MTICVFELIALRIGQISNRIGRGIGHCMESRPI
jgi:hypothetical protein